MKVKLKTVCIYAMLSGIGAGILVGYLKLSPARYIRDNYGWVGLAIYATVALGLCGIILYTLRKHMKEKERKKQTIDSKE
jgi:sugar phosphate permease